MDGRNLLPVARNGARSWENLLIQAGPNSQRDDPFGWLYRGVRTNRYTYAHYPYMDEDELYNRRSDPYELDNLAADPVTRARYAEIIAELRRRTRILGRCAGEVCQQDFAPLPKPQAEPVGSPTSDPPRQPPAPPSPTPGS